MRVILSTSMACEAANEAVVAENVWTVSMRDRKSLAERVMYCGGCVEVLSPAISDRTVGMGPEVCGEVEGIKACGTEARATGGVAGGAEETGRDTDETRAGGSPVCSAIGDKPPRGLSSIGSSSSDPEGGRWKARGLVLHRSMVRVASQPR